MLQESSIKNHNLFCSDTNIDELDHWIECVNMHGDDLSADALENLLENAPDCAKQTSDYYYMLGWLDMLYLNS